MDQKPPESPHHSQNEIDDISRIEAVPTILEVVRRTTSMRFVAVARVTDQHWVACSVLDDIGFGLKPGGELQIETTICHEIRQSRELVVIDNVAEDDTWCNHATPRLYGFQSYISAPIILIDGSFFGTLCAIDPLPARVNTRETVGMFRLFADLIAKHLEANQKLAETETALAQERELAELREQFMAVLGHDLRSPMRAISLYSELLLRTPLDETAVKMAKLMKDSAFRMRELTDNLLDLARGQSGAELPLNRSVQPLEPVLREVLAEQNAIQPARVVEADFHLPEPVDCDGPRLAQLFSNLLGNAMSYGVPDQPVKVRAKSGSDGLELSVSNAGEPIPPQILQRLFQPFFRNSVRRTQEGLGLGLYIASQIAMAHGGTLTVQSDETETRFSFRMPLPL